MENTPTGHADDLPTISGILKNEPKIEKCQDFSSGWILTQTVQKSFFTSQSSSQAMCPWRVRPPHARMPEELLNGPC